MCFGERICDRMRKKNSASPRCHPFLTLSEPRTYVPRSSSIVALIHGRWHLVAFASSTIVLANSIVRHFSTFPLSLFVKRDIGHSKWHLAKKLFSEQFLRLIRLYSREVCLETPTTPWARPRTSRLWFEQPIFAKVTGDMTNELTFSLRAPTMIDNLPALTFFILLLTK